MEFGLVITNQGAVDRSMLAAIDATRFHTLNVVDHPSFSITDPWTWLAWAAGQTSRIRLGTHVTGAPFHHPQNLARQVATVDVLSGGRATLGIGTAYEHADFHPYGYDMPSFATRVRLLEETITIIDSFWTKESTELMGEFYHLEGGAKFEPKPLQKPRPPVLIGLNTAGLALKTAVRCADGINTWQLGPKQLTALFPLVREACVAAGRDPAGFALTSDAVFARGATEEQANAVAERISNMARGWGRSVKVTDWDASGVMHGDAHTMVEQARAFAAVGVSELAVSMSSMDDIQWFSDEVIARFAKG